MLLTSPPAQKARPAPVSTITLTAGSPASRGSPCSKPSMIGVDSAFIRSGRLKVSVATPSSMVSISSGMMSRPFLSVWPVSRRQQALEAASDDRLRASAMIRSISSLQVGMSWMSPATMPQLQAAASISPSCRTRRFSDPRDEVANVFDRRGSALVALDGEDLLDRRIGQHPLGIAQWPHDQARLQFIRRDQRLLDVVVRRRLLRGDERACPC